MMPNYYERGFFQPSDEERAWRDKQDKRLEAEFQVHRDLCVARKRVESFRLGPCPGPMEWLALRGLQDDVKRLETKLRDMRREGC
jgi:hypothetical protein